jgi:hypothetical protein
MNKKSKYSIDTERLLVGDHQEILRFGDYFSRINSLPAISPEKMKAYLAGKPVYLGEQSKGV